VHCDFGGTFRSAAGEWNPAFVVNEPRKREELSPTSLRIALAEAQTVRQMVPSEANSVMR
jgi:hypothetical protein